MAGHKCKCGKFMTYCKREIYNNLKDSTEGIHYEGWYICVCGEKIREE